MAKHIKWRLKAISACTQLQNFRHLYYDLRSKFHFFILFVACSDHFDFSFHESSNWATKNKSTCENTLPTLPFCA